MDDQDPAPFWRLLLIMALLGVAFWIWLAVALLLPALAEVSAHGREYKEFSSRQFYHGAEVFSIEDALQQIKAGSQ